jgi:hypothetical protein
MQSYREWRDEFVYNCAKVGIDLDVAWKLMKLSTTLQRLATAACNGDYPADGGSGKWETTECLKCGSHWAKVHTSKGCSNCQAQQKVIDLLEDIGWEPYFDGDPRGCVLRLYKRGDSIQDVRTGAARTLSVPHTFC